MKLPIIYQVICKKSFNYFYYKNVPKTFYENDDFIIKKIYSSKINLKKIF